MNGQGHPESYYAASANTARARPPLAGEERVDVCVVGGGYCGLSTALELAERGYRVALLEANRIGWGASGRNGGQICTAYPSGMEPLVAALGAADARRLFDMSEEAKQILRTRIERHAIDCDLRWGYFLAAHKARQLDELRRMQASWVEDYGYRATELAARREEVRRYLATDAYVGGLFDSGAGQLHPLNYCLGLADAAEAAGARLYEGARVERLGHGTEPWAETENGRVRADFLVLCGNAYLGELVPEIRRKVMPVGNYIVATRGIGAERAATLFPASVAVADCKFVLSYYRLSADHRLLFGGGVSYTTMQPPNLEAGLRRKIREVFPELGEVPFEYLWSGHVAITMNRTPHFGRLGQRCYFAQGFSGQGVALTGLAGRVIAEAVAGQAERFDVFARLPHQSFPGGRLFRTPTLALAMLWYRMRDLLP